MIDRGQPTAIGRIPKITNIAIPFNWNKNERIITQRYYRRENTIDQFRHKKSLGYITGSVKSNDLKNSGTLRL